MDLNNGEQSLQHAIIRRPIQNWWWDDNEIFDLELSPKALLVRFYLCRCANHNDARAFPGLRTIAKKLGIGKSSVQIAIDELITKGLLKKTTRQKPGSKEHQTSIYTLMPVALAITTSSECAGDRHRGVPESGTGVPPGNRKQKDMDPDHDHHIPKNHLETHDALIEVYKFWTDNAGQFMSPLSIEKIGTYIEDGLQIEVIKGVMRRNLEKGKYNLDYLYACLNNLMKSNTLTIEDWQREVHRYEDEKRQREAQKKRPAGTSNANHKYSDDEYRKAVDEALGLTGDDD